MESFKHFKNLYEVVIFLIALLNLDIKPLFAQTLTPTSIIPPSPQNPIPFFIKKEPQIIPDDEAPIIRKIPDSNHKTIRVDRFVFKGNTVFSDRRLEEVISSYKGKNLSFEELLQVRSLITKFYNQAGYISSFAFLDIWKNQEIQTNKAVINIQIIEGKLEEIEISGSPKLHRYVRLRLKKFTSPVFNRSRLLEGLRLLQTDPLIETISAQLNPGSEIGNSRLLVRLKTRKPFQVETFADNSRSPAVGSFQRGLQLNHANPLGLGDELSLRYKNTEGSNTYSLGYSVPINSRNGTINFSYTNISSNIVERPFNKLDIIGDARAAELTFRQPLLHRVGTDSTQKFTVGLTASRIESESYLMDDPFPLSEGADEQGRTRISALRFLKNWTTRSTNTVFQLRSQLSLGIDVFDAMINTDGPDSRFIAWRGQTLWLRRMGKSSLLLRADLQLASKPLVPVEQISLGGVSTVRGYRQDTYLSDSGLALGTELRLPVLEKSSSQLQVIPFVDFGTAWNHHRNNNDERITPKLGTLLSVGLGLEYKLGNNFITRFDWGIPLIKENSNSNSKTWQENGIYFNIRYQPF